MSSRKLLLALTIACLALPISGRGFAQETNVRENPLTQADPDGANQTERVLISHVRHDVVDEKFDDLDSMASEFRRDKTRLPGGDWKLRVLYNALDDPRLTDKDTVEHLAHMQHWVKLRPESITARVALATSLHRWAWVARGSGLADTVSPEGWRLFNERIAQSQAVLEGARDMRTMCPQWYSEEMVVGLAEGWDGRKMRDLYERAIQFEPDYQYFYRQRANYLLPKWYGEDDDATRFARSAADHERGDRGDMIYFVIACAIIHRGNGNLAPFVKEMDWQRIQRGFKVQTAIAGPSNAEENELAFMAYKFNDHAVAQRQFAIIGSDWSRGVWKDRNFFQKVHDWATGHTTMR